MLDPAHFSTQTAATPSRPVLRMVENDRMAGSVPVWDSQGSASASPHTVNPVPLPDGALPYAAAETNPAGDDSFGFFDLLDMVNPLQHIPLVGTLYRNVTGDEIKPVSRIIGGAVFGGAVGAAGSLANVIIEEETGRDIAGNVVAMVRGGEAPQWRSTPQGPEQQLDSALRMVQAGDPASSAEDAARAGLPAQALAFADMGAAHTARPLRAHENSARYND